MGGGAASLLPGVAACIPGIDLRACVPYEELLRIPVVYFSSAGYPLLFSIF